MANTTQHPWQDLSQQEAQPGAQAWGLILSTTVSLFTICLLKANRAACAGFFPPGRHHPAFWLNPSSTFLHFIHLQTCIWHQLYAEHWDTAMG